MLWAGKGNETVPAATFTRHELKRMFWKLQRIDYHNLFARQYRPL
jgi:hypothetical protein